MRARTTVIALAASIATAVTLGIAPAALAATASGAKSGATTSSSTLDVRAETLPVASTVIADEGNGIDVEAKALSCGSTTGCAALMTGPGTDGAYQTYLVRGDAAGRRSALAFPVPAAGAAAFGNGLDCRSATNCIAVGTIVPYGDASSVGAVWLVNGPRVSSLAVPATVGSLVSVACPNAVDCVAVGDGGSVLVSGTTVTAIPTPADVTLTRVVCPSGSRCYGVGFEQDAATQTSTPVVGQLGWSGWSFTPLLSATALAAFPDGIIDLRIACSDAAHCVVVGRGQDATDSAHWNGFAAVLQRGVWTTPALPTPGDRAAGTPVAPGEVACAATNCTVAYDYVEGDGDTDVAFASVHNAGWTLTTVPHASGSRWIASVGAPDDEGIELADAACDASGQCSFPTRSTAQESEILTLRGSASADQTIDTPAGSEPGLQAGFACESVGNCVLLTNPVSTPGSGGTPTPAPTSSPTPEPSAVD